MEMLRLLLAPAIVAQLNVPVYTNVTYNTRELAPFSSDGCSSSPDGTLINPTQWQTCCVDHDKIYWLGGTEDERAKADLDFKSCLIEHGQTRVLAEVYYQSVRLNGGISNRSYRWGYGWTPVREYGPLTTGERDQAQKFLPLLDLPAPIHMAPMVTAGIDREPAICLAQFESKIVEFRKMGNLQMLRLEGQTMSFQVFSSACPGGYFIAEYQSTDPLLQCQRVDRDATIELKAFGECAN